MDSKVTDFPQYRMIIGRKVYYKILSDRKFIELSWIGDKRIEYVISAVQYPEILRIMDMLACDPPYQVLPIEYENLFNSND